MPTDEAPIELDKHISGPIELDEHVTYTKPEKKKKPKKIPWAFVAGIVGLVFIILLLFVNPPGSEFVENPPPKEIEEREIIYSAAISIVEYETIHDSLPSPADFTLPAGLTYDKEDESQWSLETETGLYYSSDMDIELFREGEV